MVSNIHRILTPGGSYICVSYGRPETRMGYLKTPSLNWKVEVLKVQKKSSIEVLERIDQEPFYYVYVCTKSF